VRGNLNTRLAKLDSGEYDALILAYAGLHRLGFGDRIHQSITPEISLHAVGQGALGIECRDGDAETLAVIKALEHTPTAYRCYAERAFLRELEGGCQVPIGVNTSIAGNTLNLKGLVASLDGQQLIQNEVSGPAPEAEALGIKLASMLKAQGAQAILDEIFATVGRE
jgi:hydroxymethylbilane synthase